VSSCWKSDMENCWTKPLGSVLVWVHREACFLASDLPCLVEIKVVRYSLLVDNTSLLNDLVRNQAVVSFLEKLALQWLLELSSVSDIKCEVKKLRYLQVHVCIGWSLYACIPNATNAKSRYGASDHGGVHGNSIARWWNLIFFQCVIWKYNILQLVR